MKTHHDLVECSRGRIGWEIKAQSLPPAGQIVLTEGLSALERVFDGGVIHDELDSNRGRLIIARVRRPGTTTPLRDRQEGAVARGLRVLHLAQL